MARINVRDIEDSVKERLRIRAARNGRSLEEKVRTILRRAAGGEMTAGEFVTFMDGAFGQENGVDLDLPPRSRDRSVTFVD